MYCSLTAGKKHDLCFDFRYAQSGTKNSPLLLDIFLFNVSLESHIIIDNAYFDNIDEDTRKALNQINCLIASASNLLLNAFDSISVHHWNQDSTLLHELLINSLQHFDSFVTVCHVHLLPSCHCCIAVLYS